MSWWRVDIKIDRWIERAIKHYFIPNHQSVIDDAIAQVRKIRPDLPTDDPYQQIITKEIIRVYRMANKSILRERTVRAKYTFLVTGVGSFVVIAASGGSAFVPALITALIAYTSSIVTIPMSYNLRVEGAVDPIVESYRDSLPSQQIQTVSTARILTLVKDGKQEHVITMQNENVAAATTTTSSSVAISVLASSPPAVTSKYTPVRATI
jgi:hypothetical protein